MEIDQAPMPSRLTQKPHQPLDSGRTAKRSEIFPGRTIKGKVRSRDRYKKYGAPGFDENSPIMSQNDHGVDDTMNPLDRESPEQTNGEEVSHNFIPGNSPQQIPNKCKVSADLLRHQQYLMTTSNRLTGNTQKPSYNGNAAGSSKVFNNNNYV